MAMFSLFSKLVSFLLEYGFGLSYGNHKLGITLVNAIQGRWKLLEFGWERTSGPVITGPLEKSKCW